MSSLVCDMWNLLVIYFFYWAFLLDYLPLQLESGASLLWVQLPGQQKLLSASWLEANLPTDACPGL